jgi:small-conductance mechanosensitive channel
MQWLKDNWINIAVPVLVFLGSYAAGMWLRKIIYTRLRRWVTKSRWEGSRLVAETIRRPFLHWCLLLGAYIAIRVSSLSAGAKGLSGKLIATAFILYLSWIVINLCETLINLYAAKLESKTPAAVFATNAVRITVVIFCILVLLTIWVIPPSPLLLVLLAAIMVAALVFRDTLTNAAAKIQLSITERIKPGYYIKLDSGEEGNITEINWVNTNIESLDKHRVVIPNSKLLLNTVTIYAQAPKKAKEPFHFNSRLNLTELTGLKAATLGELLDVLKKAPDSIIYYHTHHFLEEHHYLTPEPANDFAVWVTDALGDNVLGEKLASVDTFAFSSLSTLRDRLVGIIEEHIASGGSGSRAVIAGREFHFMKSVSVIFPTPYFAHDLREFVEALRKISLHSLYFHVFESRMRLGRGLNDFSAWLKNDLDETDLSLEIARLDPYTYSLEGLRSALIQLIEKRIR